MPTSSYRGSVIEAGCSGYSSSSQDHLLEHSPYNVFSHHSVFTRPARVIVSRIYLSRAMTSRKFILASRASQLAQNQTNMVRDILTSAFVDIVFDTFFTTTSGDHNQSEALYLLGGKALWTKELEVALQEGAVDMLVHCYKDVPTVLPEGCEIAGILEREDPVDSLVVKKSLPYKSLEELPDGSVVGTSSVRRVAQLKRLFPKLVFMDVVRIFPVQLRLLMLIMSRSEGTCKSYFSAHRFMSLNLTVLQEHSTSQTRRRRWSIHCSHLGQSGNGPRRIGLTDYCRSSPSNSLLRRISRCPRHRDSLK